MRSQDIMVFMDGLIADMAIHHSFYGISYKEYIDKDTEILPQVKANFTATRKDLLGSRIWQYRLAFIRNNVAFAVYTIAEEIPDSVMKKKKEKITHIREFFKKESIDQIWNVALQQFCMYSMNQMYAIELQNQEQQRGQVQNVQITSG